MSIKFLAEDDRPREKFLLKGKNAVSDAELLAIIMGSGSRNESAVELARRILDSVGNNFHELSKLSLQDLMKFKGVGEAKAISIATALEIGRRRASQEVPERKRIGSSAEAFQIFKPHLSDLQTEEVWAVFVNQSNKVLHLSKMTSGGITASMVDVRTLFKTALEHFATGIFLAHNHPSGNLRPSEDDRRITKQVSEAGKILNIILIDHLILNQTSYFSFADEGLL
ncbi:RadC family protein [Chryseobacterium taklimakanense]|uniref:DNA repair protein RadC n=1 Tax=Chryseobacterium taklimakanense TaxID=536441 RepID=A0A3G8WGZ9_9FLAO|nr:DNA repair protein RadC [Chryseobacterium taklimakanense]AZI20460.1 DNA repair protein RadC [Chryseobacterium taklimakanense]